MQTRPALAVRRAVSRGLGVGRALLAAVARAALEEGYCRIDWTTDVTDAGAQRPYDGLGVPREDKCLSHLTGEHLARIAHAT